MENFIDQGLARGRRYRFYMMPGRSRPLIMKIGIAKEDLRAGPSKRRAGRSALEARTGASRLKKHFITELALEIVGRTSVSACYLEDMIKSEVQCSGRSGEPHPTEIFASKLLLPTLRRLLREVDGKLVRLSSPWLRPVYGADPRCVLQEWTMHFQRQGWMFDMIDDFYEEVGSPNLCGVGIELPPDVQLLEALPQEER